MIFSTYNVEVRFESLSSLTGLENLELFNEPPLKKLSPEFLSSLSSRLTCLRLKSFDFIDSRADCLAVLSGLEILELSDCRNLAHIDLEVLPRLESLVIKTRLDSQDQYYVGGEELMSDETDQDELPLFGHRGGLGNLRRVELCLFEPSEADWTRLRGFKHDKQVTLDLTLRDWLLESDWLMGFSNLESLVVHSVRRIQRKHLQFNESKSFSRFVSDTPNAFTGLDKLVSLDISRNWIDSINSEAFRGLTSLKLLNLARNGLVHLEPGLFGDLTSLEELNLSENEITRIESGVFTDLRSLKRLLLTANKIESISRDAFGENLNNLERLELSNNCLRIIDTHVLEHIANLKNIGLARNREDSGRT